MAAAGDLAGAETSSKNPIQRLSDSEIQRPGSSVGSEAYNGRTAEEVTEGGIEEESSSALKIENERPSTAEGGASSRPSSKLGRPGSRMGRKSGGADEGLDRVTR